MEDFYERKGIYGTDPAKEQDRGAHNRLRQTLKTIKEQQPQVVLDIGCGNGFFAQRIHEETGAKVYGIDISHKGIEEAIKRGIVAKQCDLNQNISFESEIFDLVLCGEVIEHVNDPDHLMDEIYRILKPGGKLVLSTPNLAAWYNRILLLLGIQPVFSETSTRKNLGRRFKILGQGSQPVGHLHIFTLTALKDIFNEHGFTICKIMALPFLPFSILFSLDKMVGNIIPSMGSDFLMLAQKKKTASGVSNAGSRIEEG